MSSVTSALSMQTIRRLSNTERLNAAGLLLTAGAMLLQIAAGSTLYPSVTASDAERAFLTDRLETTRAAGVIRPDPSPPEA